MANYIFRIPGGDILSVSSFSLKCGEDLSLMLVSGENSYFLFRDTEGISHEGTENYPGLKRVGRDLQDKIWEHLRRDMRSFDIMELLGLLREEYLSLGKEGWILIKILDRFKSFF